MSARPNHYTSQVRPPDESSGDHSPADGRPAIKADRRGLGIRVPWVWIFGVAPLWMLGGAGAHMGIFGNVPSEIAKVLESQGKSIDEHGKALTEHHEQQALQAQQLSSLVTDVHDIKTMLRDLDRRTNR